MRGSRVVVLVAALLLVGVFIVPTGGFSSVESSRGIGVVVVSDDAAYLGIERDCSNGTLYVVITNRVLSRTSLEIDIAVNGTTKTIDGLAPGQSQTTRFATFNTDGTITIEASGPGVAIHLRRPLPAGC